MRRDARWVERMKADIRTEVEENLKAHETRLRLSADLRLRVHDRSWQILREVIGASFEARQEVGNLAVAPEDVTTDPVVPAYLRTR